MSFSIALYITPAQLKRYVCDHYWGGGKNYIQNFNDAIDNLIPKFSARITSPYNIALIEVMCMVAKSMGEATGPCDMEDIFNEVEEIFEEADYPIPHPDVLNDFYLLCPMLYHYLIDEEQIDEFNDFVLEFIVISHHRVDLTFKD